MEERTRFQAWAPTLALVAVPAVAAALAITLVPSRIKNVARRASSTEDPSFYGTDTAQEAAASQAAGEPGEASPAPAEVAALEPSPPVAVVGAEPSDVAHQPSAVAPAPGDSVAPVDSATPTPNANEAATRPAPRPLVSVWPSSRRLRQSARQAAAAEAARASASDAEPASTAPATAEPTYVYVPVAVPLPMVEVTEGEASGVEAAPDAAEPSGAGVAVFVNLPADE